MNEQFWSTSTELRQLLCELVSWKSETLSEGERKFSHKLKGKLGELSYFQKHPYYLKSHEVDLGRSFVSALYKHPESVDTIVLISHFDTVQTEEYGALEHLAFQPEELTRRLLDHPSLVPESVRKDLQSGDYLFGRGTMDMKMGLALHMQLIEKASIEKWPINLLLVTVPDEEVNSAGMRKAVVELVKLRKTFGLEYKLFLNT